MQDLSPMESCIGLMVCEGCVPEFVDRALRELWSVALRGFGRLLLLHTG